MTSGPCHISIMEQCEISALASFEKELYMSISKARDSNLIQIGFQKC